MRQGLHKGVSLLGKTNTAKAGRSGRTEPSNQVRSFPSEGIDNTGRGLQQDKWGFRTVLLLEKQPLISNA